MGYRHRQLLVLKTLNPMASTHEVYKKLHGNVLLENIVKL